ncbi:MAG: C2H2-type zinc finger protein, partial [Gammaproteobacteria bacterium]|nr:C2H2-type zinc finger protein [Gammaproteobacteria bacterium]
KNTHIHINDDEENLDIEGVDDYEPELDIEGDDSKKLSAYSAAPQRLSCPYCARKFPWASSLERHILTHTGQKPYKCTECPLWFTTKSNCDRHIVRKHGNNKDDEASYSGAEDEEQGFHMPLNYANTDSIDIEDGSNTQVQHKTARRDSTGSESPYKCHICDEGFGERQLAISHIQLAHQDEFLALQAKGAFDEDNSCSQLTESAGEEQLYDQLRGKFPDYSNRKIICLFCSRKFWSAEDLRRHVRTHSGERPYSCDICNRKFTLKHSML